MFRGSCPSPNPILNFWPFSTRSRACEHFPRLKAPNQARIISLLTRKAEKWLFSAIHAFLKNISFRDRQSWFLRARSYRLDSSTPPLRKKIDVLLIFLFSSKNQVFGFFRANRTHRMFQRVFQFTAGPRTAFIQLLIPPGSWVLPQRRFLGFSSMEPFLLSRLLLHPLPCSSTFRGRI